MSFVKTLLSKNCFAGALLVAANASLGQTSQLDELRILYYAASQDKSAANHLFEKLESTDETEPARFGYRGMSNFMQAYHAINPLSKLRFFLAGKAILERAIQVEPDNTELRYLRFTVQTNAPAFLNYRRCIQEDKKFLLEALMYPGSKELDKDLRERILEYMFTTKHCTKAEREKLTVPKFTLE